MFFAVVPYNEVSENTIGAIVFLFFFYHKLFTISEDHGVFSHHEYNLLHHTPSTPLPAHRHKHPTAPLGCFRVTVSKCYILKLIITSYFPFVRVKVSYSVFAGVFSSHQSHCKVVMGDIKKLLLKITRGRDSAGVENHCSDLPKTATRRPRHGLVLPSGGLGSTARTLELPALENTSRRQPLCPVPAHTLAQPPRPGKGPGRLVCCGSKQTPVIFPTLQIPLNTPLAGLLHLTPHSSRYFFLSYKAPPASSS